jgi:NADH-quinone oxidoreductase subunit H
MIEIALEAGVKAAALLAVVMTAVAYASWVERKVSSWLQDRLGPNRVGPAGLLQPLADGLKFVLKEDIVPINAHKPFYVAAPAISLVAALSAFAVVPFGSSLEIFGRVIPLKIADINAGVLFFLALGSLNVYGLLLGGWSSGSKYSLLGGLRASAQVVSYELAMGLSIIGVLMVAGSLRLDAVVDAQAGGFWRWNLVTQPVAALVFLVAAFAETNRLPFDLPEAEAELVAGYHTEYSAMKFAMFFMAEYAHMFAASALMTVLFLGGWHLPLLDPAALGWSTNAVGLVHLGVMAAKIGTLVFVFVWVRWTLPRFRYDQLMGLGWKVLFPLTLANIAYVGAGIALRLPWLGGFAP